MVSHTLAVTWHNINPFKPEFTIVIFIHYKPRFVVDEDDLMWFKK